MGIGIGRRQCMPLGMLAVQIPRHLLQLRMLLLLGGGSEPRSMEDLRIRVRTARRGGRRTEEAGGVGIAGVGRLGLGLGLRRRLRLDLSPGQIQLGGGLLLLRGRDDSGLLMILRLLLLLLLLCSPPAAGGGVLAEEGVVRIICSRHDLLARVWSLDIYFLGGNGTYASTPPKCELGFMRRKEYWHTQDVSVVSTQMRGEMWPGSTGRDFA